MAEADNKVLNEDDLSMYDALIKHYISLQYPKVSSDQIDELFEDEDNNLVSFSTGSDEKIAEMINNYYDNKITLAEIQSVWHVGDTREITLSAIAASGGSGNDAWTVGETHRAQTVTIQILDFVHDTLASNYSQNALITVDLKNCLRDATVANNDGANNTENGYLHQYAYDFKWSFCNRRKWCNDGFYQALPEYIRNLIKQVQKVTTQRPNSGSSATLQTTSDKIFLLSETEVIGSNDSYGTGNEGTQYELYKIQDNRIKLPKFNNNFDCQSNNWWCRTPVLSNQNQYVYIESTNLSNAKADVTTNYGIAPAFCL